MLRPYGAIQRCLLLLWLLLLGLLLSPFTLHLYVNGYSCQSFLRKIHRPYVQFRRNFATFTDGCVGLDVQMEIDVKVTRPRSASQKRGQLISQRSAFNSVAIGAPHLVTIEHFPNQLSVGRQAAFSTNSRTCVDTEGLRGRSLLQNFSYGARCICSPPGFEPNNVVLHLINRQWLSGTHN